MSGRVTGYHYARRADGTKYRVYGDSTKAPRRKKGGSSSGSRSGSRNYSKKGSASAGQRKLKGHGGYYDSSFVKAMGRALPSGSFEKAGSMVGGPLGGWAGAQLAKIAGFGDYQVSTNSLIGEGQSPAVMHSNSDRTVVRHREYIMDITSSTLANNFQNQSLPIQPGLSGSFPWLAPISQQFEQYCIKGMVFEFKTLFADAIASSQANSSVGGVIMATDYNVLNPAFTNKQQMDNTQYTTSCKPSVSFYHPIECKPGTMPTNQLFIRSGSPQGTPQSQGDLRLYDLGNFQIASFGIAAESVVLGELWCSYEIEFSKPINNGATANVLSDHFQLGGTVSATFPLGTASKLVANSSIGGSISAGIGYQFPTDILSGNFLMLWSVGGTTASSLNSPTITANSGATILSLWNVDSSAAAIAPAAGTSNTMMVAIIVQISSSALGGGNVVFGTSGTLPSAITFGDLWVTELDSDIQF